MAYTLIDSYHTSNYYSGSAIAEHYGQPRSIRGITIHWWGDPSRNPTFEGTAAYLCRAGGNTSAHEVIEAGRVARLCSHDVAAWHAGSAVGNATTIGLECNPRASDEDYATIAERIRDLRAAYGDLPLYPHKHWYNTACPGVYDLARLDAMARALDGGTVPASNPITPPPPPAPSGPVVIAPGVPAPPFPLPEGHVFGPKSGPVWCHSGFYNYRDDLRRWQQRMQDRGWVIDADGLYGPQTAHVTHLFQAEKGLVVDELIGPVTWAAAWTEPVTRG